MRLRAAAISQTSGFVDNDPKKGFKPYGWFAQAPEGDFEFHENQDTNTGWFKNFELILNGHSGTYDCALVEAKGPFH